MDINKNKIDKTHWKRINFYDNKYTILINENGVPMEALRYGEPWQDIIGDNLIYHMLCRILELEDEIESLKAI